MELGVLYGKIALGDAQPKDYTAWAEALLLAGHENENLSILASLGLDNAPNRLDVERYFSLCVAELHLCFPATARAIRDYALFLCKAICEDDIAPRTGLGLLSRFWYQAEYDDSLYRIWEELSKDIDSLEHGGDFFWNSGLQQSNIDAYIIQVAEQFITLCTIELPEDFFDLTVCKKCRHIGRHAIARADKAWISPKVYELLYKRKPSFHAVCAQCGEAYPRRMDDYESRRIYLDTLGIYAAHEAGWRHAYSSKPLI